MVYNLSIIWKQKNKDFFILLSILKELYFFYNKVNNFKTILEGIIKDLLYKLKAEIALYNLKEY
jgi:hypothetical protein